MQILKVIGLLMEYPDELLWECKEDALALIRRDACSCRVPRSRPGNGGPAGGV